MTTKEEKGLCIVRGCHNKQKISLGLCQTHAREFRNGERSVMIDGHELTYENWADKKPRRTSEQMELDLVQVPGVEQYELPEDPGAANYGPAEEDQICTTNGMMTVAEYRAKLADTFGAETVARIGRYNSEQKDLPLFQPTRVGRPNERLRQEQYDRIMQLREQLGYKLKRSKTGMITRAEAAKLIAELEYQLKQTSGSQTSRLGYPDGEAAPIDRSKICEIGRQVRIETLVGGELKTLSGRLLGYK